MAKTETGKQGLAEGRETQGGAACCVPEAKASCCQPSEKATCCKTTDTTGRCGCR
jgi:hypothetical protein